MIAQSLYRTCIPAEAKPTLNSSSCYPLVNFTRPFCQNLGITLPNYVYHTPDNQNEKNDEANADFDILEKANASKISRFFKVDISTVRKCGQALPIWYCHLYFPSCDRTQSVFKEQKICRESYLELTHIVTCVVNCGKSGKIIIQLSTRRQRSSFLANYNRLGMLVTHQNAGISMDLQILQVTL